MTYWPPRAESPQGRKARLEYEQKIRCEHGEHRWGPWGLWAALPVVKPFEVLPIGPIPPEPFKTARWRSCLFCDAQECDENY